MGGILSLERNFSREFQETDTQTIIEKVKIGVMETGLGAGTTFAAKIGRASCRERV